MGIITQLLKTYKSKKWTKRIVNKNLKAISIDCEKYIHHTDRKALAVLNGIPFFDKICSKILSVINEPQEYIMNMSSKIHITQNQLPKVYNMVRSICNRIGITMPDLYLQLDREPNAFAFGTENISITITSGLLECLEDDELYAVLAHECGHIACKHMLYHSMAKIIFDVEKRGVKRLALVNTIIEDVVSTPLKLALYYWERCSELSADRVAAICCASGVHVVETMMRFAGGTTHVNSEIDTDLFINQAEEYHDFIDDSKITKFFEYCLTFNNSHPLHAIRAYEAREWTKSQEFADLLKVK